MRKEFPPIKLDPKSINVGDKYTTVKGDRVTVVGKDGNGFPILRKYVGPALPKGAIRDALTGTSESEDDE
jgi:hypothetical protein